MTGVNVAPIEVFTGEGIPPAGEQIVDNSKKYTDAHASRIQLLRTLLDSGGFRSTSAREVMTALDTADRRRTEIVDQLVRSADVIDLIASADLDAVEASDAGLRRAETVVELRANRENHDEQ